MHSRKIQLVGKRSYTVSLPKEWIIRNSLKQGNLLFLEDFNNNIIVSKGEKKEKEIIVEISLDEIKDIEHFIGFCYLKNVEKIIILFDRKDKEKLETIRKILQKFEGYKIIDESQTKVEIAFFFKDIGVNLNDIIRRMIFIIGEMANGLNKKDKSFIIEMENTLDSLNFLSRRIIFSSLNNHNAFESSYNLEDKFFYLSLTRRLERIGDLIYEYKDKPFSKEDVDLIIEILGFLDNFFYLKKREHDFALNKKEIKSNNPDIQKFFYKLIHFFEDVSNIFNSINLNNSFTNFIKKS